MLIITIKEHTLAVGAAGKHGQQNHYQSRGVGLCLLKVLFYSFFFCHFSSPLDLLAFYLCSTNIFTLKVERNSFSIWY